MTRKSTPALAILATLAAILAACGGDDAADPQVASEPETIEIQTRWASGLANDLPTLLASTDEAFIGRVTANLGQIDSEHSSPGRQPFPLTRFEVTVTESIDGTLTPGGTVVIEQPGGVTTVSGGSQARLVLEGDEPLQVGSEHLFFAHAGEDGAYTVSPFARLELMPDGSLEPLERWTEAGALQELSALSRTDAAARVAAAE